MPIVQKTREVSYWSCGIDGVGHWHKNREGAVMCCKKAIREDIIRRTCARNFHNYENERIRRAAIKVRILDLRQKKMNYKEIGKIFGFSAVRAREIAITTIRTVHDYPLHDRKRIAIYADSISNSI